MNQVMFSSRIDIIDKQAARTMGAARSKGAVQSPDAVPPELSLSESLAARSASKQQIVAGTRPNSRPLTIIPTTSRNQIIRQNIRKYMSDGSPMSEPAACQPTTVPTANPQSASSIEASAVAIIRGAASRPGAGSCWGSSLIAPGGFAAAEKRISVAGPALAAGP